MEKSGSGWLSRQELPVWLLVSLFFILACAVFWIFGFSRLPFPV